VGSNNNGFYVFDQEEKKQTLFGIAPWSLLATVALTLLTSWHSDPVRLKIVPLLLTPLYSVMALSATVGLLSWLKVEWMTTNFGIVFFMIGWFEVNSKWYL
jgi:hypothetical protein